MPLVFGFSFAEGRCKSQKSISACISRKTRETKSCVKFSLFLDSHLSPPLSAEKKRRPHSDLPQKMERKEKRKNPNCRFRRLARSFVSFRNSFSFSGKDETLSRCKRKLFWNTSVFSNSRLGRGKTKCGRWKKITYGAKREKKIFLFHLEKWWPFWWAKRLAFKINVIKWRFNIAFWRIWRKKRLFFKP